MIGTIVGRIKPATHILCFPGATLTRVVRSVHNLYRSKEFVRRSRASRAGPSKPFMSLHRQVRVGHDRLSRTKTRLFPPVGQSHTERRLDASNRVGPLILKRHHVPQRQLLSAALNRHLIGVAPVTLDPPCIFPRCPGTFEKEKVPTVAHQDWGGIPEGDYLSRESLTLSVCRTPSPI